MKRIFILIVVLGLISAAILGGIVYKAVYAPNVSIKETKELFIHTGADYEQVKEDLAADFLIDVFSFDKLAKRMNYPSHVYAGRYVLEDGMSNRALILMLRSGKQKPVKVVFNKARSISEIGEIVSAQLEFEAGELEKVLTPPFQIEGLEDFDQYNILALFIPNTYEFYWNTSAEKFVQRMKKEYDRYWTSDKKAAAKRLGLNSQEVIALASIVEEESNISDERPIIAGLYLNRLKKGMLLQADPTVRYALGDFEIRRVLTKHLKTESPYNTYLNKGLPPGPICTPSQSSINAVLNPREHNYLYMCAKADFSGRHAFANTLNEHLRNARAFQKALNEKKIYQ